MAQQGNLRTIQTNFTAGELSPRLYGRVDVSKYYNGAKVLLNMFPWAHGGATRRTGTQFVIETKTSTKKSRLIPFVFSTTQSYMLEFGDLYFRICRNRAQVASAGVPTEVVTVYTENDLVNLKWTQSQDTLYIAHPSYAPYKVTRTSDTAWTITKIAFQDGPYLPQNTSATTLTPSAATGSITVTASAATFVSTDVGRLIRIQEGGSWSWLTITAFTSSTVVTATVSGANLAATAAVTTWRLGAWSDTTGWPSTVSIYQQRTVWGCSTSQPNTLWGSNAADYENMAPSKADGTVQDNHAYTFTIADDKVNAIRWFSPGKSNMLMGTSDGEYTVFGQNASGSGIAITATNININRETTHGSASNVRIRRIANSVFFTQPSRRRVRRSAYDYRSDGYVAEDVTLFSEHISLSGIIDFDYQEEIDSAAWAIRTDGTLIGFTYDKAQDVIAWHRHQLGGSFVNGPVTTNYGVVESVGVIKNPTLSGEDVWLIVKRTINGVTKRYIEYITSPYDPDTNFQRSMWFVDAGIQYNGYLAANLTPAAASGSAVSFTADAAVFDVTMVGKQIRSGSARATITGFVSSTVIIADILSTNPFPSTTQIAQNSWYVGAQSFTGASHLEGLSCQVSADGAAIANATPTGGAFTLDDYYGMVTVGLGYNSDIQTLPDEVAALGTSEGLMKKINKASIFFYQSLGCKFCEVPQTGLDATKFEQLPTRSTSDSMNIPPPLFSGIKMLRLPGPYDIQPTVYIRQDQPLPMTVLFVTKEFTVNG